MSEQSKGSPTAAELRHRAEIARREGQHGRSDALLAGAAAMERAERLEAALREARDSLYKLSGSQGGRWGEFAARAWDAANAALAQEGGAWLPSRPALLLRR